MSETPDLKDERRRRLLRAVARAATSGSKIGMWDGRLDALLNGELRPSSLDLALIAEAAGVTVSWLLGEEDEGAPV